MLESNLLKQYQEKVSSVLLNIISSKSEDRVINPSIQELEDLKTNINLLFEDSECLEIIFTKNLDKQLFGIKISPNINNNDALIILTGEDRVKFNKYKLEIDSKLFDLNLYEDELASLIIYQISNIIDNYNTIDVLRASIDSKMVTDNDVINIRDSVNYAQLIIFAIKDTINKIGNFLYVEDPDVFTNNTYINALELEEEIISARDKVINSSIGASEMIRTNRPTILEWMLTMYKNMKINSSIIIDTLKDAKAFTASKLDIDEINKTLLSIDRIDNEITFANESLNKFFDRNHMSAINESSLFKSLKKYGLRGIENELYEYHMRVKQCTDTDEATLIMRGINSRISILDDYLTNEDLSDNDYRHWTNVSNSYKDLRVALTKKKLQDKQYGLFYRYDKLDDEDYN